MHAPLLPSAGTAPLTSDELRKIQQKNVLDYVLSRGIQGAWFEDNNNLRAPGNVPLREVTGDAGINWGGGGMGGKDAYSQVNPALFIHPEERARCMLADCFVAVAMTGELPENMHEIYVSKERNLVTASGHIAMPFNAEIGELLPLFEARCEQQCQDEKPRVGLKGPQ